MKKILIAALAGLAVLAGLLLAAPSLIDWNAYKGAIAERVSQATGRQVELHGDVGFTLLPSPALTVRDARLANAAGAAEPDMLRLKKLDARVALGPLLGGRIQVESIALVEPTFVVEVLKDGRINWDLSTAGPRAGDGLGAAEGLVSAVSFDQVMIDNGTIIYRDDRNGRTETVEKLNARIAAGSLNGPFQLQGDFRLRGLSLHGEATAGRFTEGAAVPVRATLSMPHTDATLRFAGILTGGNGGTNAGGGSKVQGDLRAEGSDFAKLVDAPASGWAPAALSQSFSLRATVEAGTSLATFSGLEAQLGDTRATGNATLRAGDPAKRESPRTELTLAVNRLDLDAWLAQGGRNGAAASNGSGSGRGTPAPAAGAAGATGDRAPLPSFALPTGVEAKLDVAIDAIGYNRGVVRQGRIEASLSAGRLNIDRVSALLPGGSDFVAAGEVTTPGGQPTLDLRMEANADNLRALLEWAKLDPRGVPADRLRRASLSARLQGHADRFELSGLDFRFDSSRLSGAVAYVDRGRPAFGARLELDRLNLDGYLPADPAPTQPALQTQAQPQPAPRAAASDGGQTTQRLLGLADANLDLRVGQLTVGGLPVQGLHLDATVASGALTVREAKVEDLAGLQARIDGQVASLIPLRGVNLALAADAKSLGGLPSAVSWPSGLPVPERLGAVSVKARLAGDGERLAVEASAGMLGGTAEAGGALLGLDRKPEADLKLRVTHPEMGRIAALFTDSGLARAYGPLDLYGELSGNASSPALKNLQGLVAGIPVRGRLTLDRKSERAAFQADIQTGDLDLDRLRNAPLVGDGAGRTANVASDPAADLPPADPLSDLSWMQSLDGRLGLTSTSLTVAGQRIVQPALRATLDNGVATLEQLDGEWQGGQIGASGRLAAAPGQAPKLDADLTVIKADMGGALSGFAGLGLSGGTVDLDVTLSGSGRGDALLRSLTGRGRAVASGGVLRGVDLGALRSRLAGVERTQEVLGAVAGALQGGETKLDRLDARFVVDKGEIRTEDARLTTAPADGTLTGTISLPEERVDLGLTLAVKADGDLPPLTLRMAGPWATPTQTLDLKALRDHFNAAAPNK
ncbi:AsmA-like C-terminal region [Azospirillum oryzae]|uniref:AsmA-like C-terminal region n=1 Tax=Azospirillum oryzae TaxID=286727 RepID=A0A1X7H2I3_9PROT|nr:AsmA family protein [Azospirillum oryzae]SMF78164.1 AsmA-like C-terminal region [Azospirillum oryzae]